MGMINYNPLKNAASTAQSYLNKIFKNAQPQTPQQNIPAGASTSFGQQAVPGYGFNPYQIQKGDTFKQIADKQGMTEQHIQAANNGMLVPPPSGSYINIPRPGFAAQSQVPGFGEKDYFQRTRDEFLNGVYGASQTSAYRTNSFTGPNGQVNTAELIANIQNSPTAPTNVPAGVLSSLTINGAPATPQSMQANGYTFNQATQSWVLKGSQAAQQGLTTTAAGTGSAEFMNTGFMQRYAANGTPFLQQKRWSDRTHRYETIGHLLKIGELDLKGRTHRVKGRGGGQQVQPVQASNAGGTPGTVLELHLGSG